MIDKRYIHRGLRILLVAILASILSGCVSFPQLHNPAHDGASNVVSICEIRAKRNTFIGRTVRTKGIFESDGMTFSYLQDKQCAAESNTIRVSSLSTPKGDSTVVDFVERRKESCSRTTKAYCSGGFSVDVLGAITENREGLLQIDLLHVYQADEG